MDTKKDYDVTIRKCCDGWTQSSKNDRECYRLIEGDVPGTPRNSVVYIDKLIKDGFRVLVLPK